MYNCWKFKTFTALIAGIFIFSQAFSSVFIVPDDFPTIQSAVDELSQDDTIMIRPGVYYENIEITGNKNLTLTSFYEILDDPGLVFETIIDGSGAGAVFNIHDNAQLTVLKGFMIRNGYNDHGGGIVLKYADLVAENLVIRNNDTWDVWSNSGGGIYAVHCNLVVRNTEISYNSAYDYGGGVSVRNGGQAHFENVIFIGNNTSNAYGHGKGAGLHCDYGAHVEVDRCIFTCNNSARWGGAFAANTSAKLRITNTVSFGNHAAMGGGGLYLCYFDARVDICNSVFYLDYPQEIYFDNNSGGHSDSVIVLHSIVQGGQAGVYVPPTMYLEWLEGNSSQDPGFADPMNYDFSLVSGSACVDSGTELYVLRNDTLVYIPQENWYGYAPDLGAEESDYLAGYPDNPEGSNGIIISPNPCRDHVKIRTTDPAAQIHEIMVINRDGKAVSIDGDLTMLPPGLYIVRVSASNGVFYSKVIKGE